MVGIQDSQSHDEASCKTPSLCLKTAETAQVPCGAYGSDSLAPVSFRIFAWTETGSWVSWVLTTAVGGVHVFHQTCSYGLDAGHLRSTMAVGLTVVHADTFEVGRVLLLRSVHSFAVPGPLSGKLDQNSDGTRHLTQVHMLLLSMSEATETTVRQKAASERS